MQKILITLVSLLGATTAAAAEPASLLIYRVVEPGIEPYISRMIVTDDHVRLDEGADGEAYTLFDRQQEIIYNVSPLDRTILVMQPARPLPDDNEALVLQEQVKADDAAPLVAGRQPKDVRLLANGEVCSELVVVEGVMDDAVEALSELKLVLARIQAASAEAQGPLSIQTPCELANNVYAADRSLRFGLPIVERAGSRMQSLVDFSTEYEADKAMFALPNAYSRRGMNAANAI